MKRIKFPRLSLKSKGFKNAIIFIVPFAAIGVMVLAFSQAANLVTVNVDFATLNAQPNFYPYEESQIRIQKNGGSADAALLENIGVKHERSFVRLDKWKPTQSSPLKTEHGRYGLGDSWLEEMNQRGIAPWVTIEVDSWKRADYTSWYINGPISATEQKQYEDLLYEILTYIKNKSPQTKIVEMMNEPNLLKFKLNNEDQVNLFLSGSRVVNRINREQGLPKPNKPALIHGGPSSIRTAYLPNTKTGEIQFKSWVDGVFAAPDFDQVKPAFFSYHTFGPGPKPFVHEEMSKQIREYLDSPKFAGKWKDVPIWTSAYSPDNSGASEDADGGDTLRSPANYTPVESARGASGFAAVHHFMMNGNVEYASMFAQSNYIGYKFSLLLPESQTSQNKIPYYKPGAKTPLYNYYEMLSKINGSRVKVTSSGTGSITRDGQGYGTDAVMDSNKGWLLSWNYYQNGTGQATDVNYILKGLRSIGIENNESARVNVYLIDDKTSNITNDNTKGGLQLIDTINLPSGETRNLNYSVRGLATVLFEIVGTNDTGSTSDTTPPIVNLNSPVVNTIVSGVTQLVATATDNRGMSKVEFLVNGNVVGQDTSTADNTFTFNFDSRSLPNGSHQISARATDTSNNRKTTTAYAINVSNTVVTACEPSGVTAPSKNVLPNYSFETINSGLNAIGDANFTWLNTDARSGKCSVQISSTDPNGSDTNQRYVGPITDIPVTPGTEYELAGWIKTTNVLQGATIRMNFWSGPNGSDFISDSTVVSANQIGTTGWRSVYGGKIVAPENAQFARIELRLTGSGTVQFDDISVLKLESTEPPADTQPPTVSIEGDSTILASSNDVNTIRISASDNGTIDRVVLRVVGGQTLSTVTSPPYNINLNPNSLPNGDHNIEAVAFDSANNSTVSTRKLLKVRLPDIDRNGKVDIGDLTFVISNWNQNNSSIPTARAYDLNNDGVVGIADLTILISNWSR